MPKHSLIATSVTVRKVRSDSSERLPVNDLDGKGLSLLDLFYAHVATGVETGGWRDARNELIVVPRDVDPAGRTVFMPHESGYYGSEGRIRNQTDLSTSYEFGVDEAPVLGRRSLLVVPEVGDYAVCLDEKVGHMALPPLFWLSFRRAVRKHHNLLVSTSHAADAAAWNSFLDGADRLLAVTYVQQPDDVGEGQVEHVPMGVRKYGITKDPDMDSLPLSLLPKFRSKKKSERKQADKLVLLPKGFEASEVSVRVETDGTQRAVDVLADDWPTFVYNFSQKGKGAPSDDVFKSDAREIAKHLLVDQLDCQLGSKWRSKAWSEARLDQRLEGVDDGDDVDPDGVGD